MRAPGGGASCLSVGRPGSSALPPPTARPLGGLPRPTTHWLWVRGDAGVWIPHQPHSARSCERALRAVGAARGRPGGAPPAWVRGVRGRALSHPRLPGLWAGCRGPLATGFGCGGCGRGDLSPTPQRALLRAVGAARGPRGARLLPLCGASGVGRSPIPNCPPSGRAAAAHYPLAVGAGGCGRVDTSPTPQRALLRAGFARCGRGTRVPGGGASCLSVGRPGSGALPPPTARPLGGLPQPTTHWLWVQGDAGVWIPPQPQSARSCELALRAVAAARGRPGGAPPAWLRGVRGRALSHPRLPGLWAGCRGPLATGFGCGGCGRGDPSPTPQRALLSAGFGRCGIGTRAPGGGASCLGVGRPGSGALPPPTARPLGGVPGPTTHWLWVRGGAGVGTRHQPHSARSCVLWGRHEGARGGAPLARVWGVRGRALSHPRLPALWAGRRGPLPTGCGCGGPRAWGPVTNPTARALVSWLCALWGRHEGTRGGRLLPGCGASGVGRSPTPNRPPSGRAAGAHYPLAVGAGAAGVGTRHQPHSARSCELALRAVGVARGRPGGGASCLGVGRPGSGALPPPTARPLGGLPGPTTHWLWVRGGAGMGTRHQPHSANSCMLRARHEGAQGGARARQASGTCGSPTPKRSSRRPTT